MKLSKGLLIVIALTGVVLAQTPSKKNAAPAKPAVSPTAKPTMPATRPHQTGAKVLHVSKHAAGARSVAHKASASEKAVEKGAKQVVSDVAPPVKHGRDPFLSVIVERTGGVSCAGSGKKCLMPEQVMLKGVVRSQADSIAVVTSGGDKTYFLHENDPVYNGVVVKITADSIVFRETVTDRLGKSTQREVVKKVSNPAA